MERKSLLVFYFSLLPFYSFISVTNHSCKFRKGPKLSFRRLKLHKTSICSHNMVNNYFDDLHATRTVYRLLSPRNILDCAFSFHIMLSHSSTRVLRGEITIFVNSLLHPVCPWFSCTAAPYPRWKHSGGIIPLIVVAWIVNPAEKRPFFHVLVWHSELLRFSCQMSSQ